VGVYEDTATHAYWQSHQDGLLILEPFVAGRRFDWSRSLSAEAPTRASST
jgi:hypothetical protein